MVAPLGRVAAGDYRDPLRAPYQNLYNSDPISLPLSILITLLLVTM